jgi:crotonobetaine/carnitine-CoA ligase
VFLKVGGLDVTFAAFDRDVGKLAAGLRAAGMGPGDRLVVMMRNSLQCVHTWFAANRLGAVWAPINTEFRGAGLQHAVGLANPKIAVCDPDLVEFLAPALTACGIEAQLFASDAAGEAPLELLGALYEREPVQGVSARFHDMSALLFTSGTTGRSKAAMLSHRYFLSQAAIAIRGFDLRPHDVLYCPFPLFHADATALTVSPALLLGATAALSPRFSASRFWSEVRAAGATVFDFMGATLSILNKAEPQPNDADNPVRLAWGVPVPEWVPDFERRFDLKVYELYGSVEASIPVVQSHASARVPGSCGRTIRRGGRGSPARVGRRDTHTLQRALHHHDRLFRDARGYS